MDTLLNFDFYGTKPNLFIKKQDSFRTYFGSVLSLITVIALTIIFIFIIFCFIYDTGLNVLYEKTSKGLGLLDLNLSKNIFFYRLNDKKSQRIDPRILKTYPYLTISTSEGTKYELLKESACNVDKLIEEDLEYKDLLNFDISSYVCITYQNGDDAILQRRTSPFKNSYINLFVAKCQNDSNLNINNCAPEEEINSFIENNSIYVSLFLESAAIDHHNYSNPITKKYYQNTMSFPKDFIFSYTFFWRKVEYYTRHSLILFNYLFHKSDFLLDATIKDKEIYSTKTNFIVDKTIGRIQFLITVEYADSYLRKYLTLIDSLTILMSVFNVITKLCWFLNYLFTKSYIYSTIFDPIVQNSYRQFSDSFDSNILSRNIFIGSPNPFTSKQEQNKKGAGDLSILRLNNKSNISLNKHAFKNTSLAPNISFEFQKNGEIQKILYDIQNNKITNKINFSDYFLFFFGKIFNFQNKKQLYLQRIERVLHDELSIDYLFQEFKTLKKAIYKDMRNNDFNSRNISHTNSTKGQSIYSISLINK